jgi:hypothetical protein
MPRLQTAATKAAARSLVDAAIIGHSLSYAIEAKSPELTRRHWHQAAAQAAKIPGRSDFLDEPASTAAIAAARRDCEILRARFGEHDQIVVGEPIDLSEEWWRDQGPE